MELIQPVVPMYDYVPPEYVSLYITKEGGQTPKYIYRLFSELYSKEELFELDQDDFMKRKQTQPIDDLVEGISP